LSVGGVIIYDKSINLSSNDCLYFNLLLNFWFVWVEDLRVSPGLLLFAESLLLKLLLELSLKGEVFTE
jgi:hypothetical protein